MEKPVVFIRNFEAGIYLESFLVAAVASLLAIRLFLQITGYPQIGGGELHIAHMLWGGLLMLASIIILLSFLSKASARLAAILGGIGFGTFIDEVGKFVTSDHNYFFQPAVALIYVTFILIYLATRAIQTKRNYSPQEYLVNALREMEEAALHDLDEEERGRSLLYLERSSPDNPLVASLRDLLARTTGVPVPTNPWQLTRIKLFVKSLYHYVSGFRWFPLIVVGFFVAQLIINVVYAFVLVFFIGLGWEQILDVRVVRAVAERMKNLSFTDSAELGSSLLSGFFVLCGVIRIRRSKLLAFRMFERSILVSIFLTQVFAFYKEQFSALLGLFLNIAVLIALQFMIDRERLKAVTSDK